MNKRNVFKMKVKSFFLQYAKLIHFLLKSNRFLLIIAILLKNNVTKFKNSSLKFDLFCSMDIRNNSLHYLREKYISDLESFYEKKEAAHLLNILIKDLFGFSRTYLATNRDIRLSESEILLLHFAVKDLKKHKPVQYILGKAEFSGLTFELNESVLIPRPETEELVNLIVANEKREKLHILDIGTGSGCIAVSLEKKMEKAQVTAIDIDEHALKIAVANAARNESEVEFFQFDILDEREWSRVGMFDIIVSNPPYVTEIDRAEMQKNVLNFEPYLALFVPKNDELIFYRKICFFALKYLNPAGRVYFEINEKKASDIKVIMHNTGFEKVEIYKDFRSKPRFISGVKAS